MDTVDGSMDTVDGSQNTVDGSQNTVDIWGFQSILKAHPKVRLSAARAKSERAIKNSKNSSLKLFHQTSVIYLSITPLWVVRII